MQDSEVCRGETCIVPFRDDAAVVRIDSEARRLPPVAGRQTFYDEMAIQALAKDSGWCRDFGIIELLPIAVVAQDGFA